MAAEMRPGPREQPREAGGGLCLIPPRGRSMLEETMRAHPFTPRWRLGLVGRFALVSLVAFVVIGAALSILTNRQVIRTQELDAQFHAQFVADSLLAQRLRGYDLSKPFTGRRYRALDRLVRAR